MLYYPFGFISTDDVKIFEFLSEISMRELYIHLVDHPGSTQSDLAKAVGMSNQATIRATKKMEGLDLINRIQDGVYARYFPTDLLLKKREEYASRMRTFQESILRRLRSEGLKPQVIRREEGMILIRLTLGSKKGVLNISTDPYTSALAT